MSVATEVRITKKVETKVTIEQVEYERILREAVGAPRDATVDIENIYGGDIVITWTTIIEGEG